MPSIPLEGFKLLLRYWKEAWILYDTANEYDDGHIRYALNKLNVDLTEINCLKVKISDFQDIKERNFTKSGH